MVPPRGALMADSIFMASTVAMASPSATVSPSATFQATRLASNGEVTALSSVDCAPAEDGAVEAEPPAEPAPGAARKSTGTPTLTSLPSISTATLRRWV